MMRRAWLTMTTLLALATLPACATSSNNGTTGTTGSGGEGGGSNSSGDGGGATTTTTTTSSTGTTTPTGPYCGDGKTAVDESCDDGNSDPGDGCDANCDREEGWDCTGEPSVCTPKCGDGKVLGKEECDDGNAKGADGCTITCKVEYGWSCEGTPSKCATSCGDGIIVAKEACDDKNSKSGDGCSESCQIEPGWECAFAPSQCQTVCGDGLIAGTEQCDDDNNLAGDGCDDACKPEADWTCMGQPTKCTTPCGDGKLLGDVACDDGNNAAGDGCAPDCKLELGYACTGEPSVCGTVCGDGLVFGAELCDDGNSINGDGCDLGCVPEPGFTCVNGKNLPSVCTTVCGDGYPAGGETCDDGNTVAGDGCNAVCAKEFGYVCSGVPSKCQVVCGDGQVAAAEACDDGNTDDGDGCSSTCAKEAGWTCTGNAPSVCVGVCGDGIIVGAEACDDKNINNGDCCSSTCLQEAGCEVEPNDTFAQANDIASLGGNGQIKAVLKGGTEVDVFYLDISLQPGERAAITAETLDGPIAGTTCAGSTIDSYLTVYDENYQKIAEDDDNGAGVCSLLTATQLTQGRYYFEVKTGASTPKEFSYVLKLTKQITVCGNGAKEVGEQCDDGNLANGDGCTDTCKIETQVEIEPNNTAAQATANGAFATNKLWSGAINPIADADWYMFTLPTVSDVKIETFDGNGPGFCDTIDPQIFVYKADGTTELANDDQDGINSCALVDPSTDAGMRQLPPGNYFLKMIRWNNSAVIAAYNIQVTLTAVCGNGVKEGYEACDGGQYCDASCKKIAVCGDGALDPNESCDDGNTTANDGCSATCQVESGYKCTGAPSVCQQYEVKCNDGIDNDGDGNSDCNDADCAIGCAVAACGVGETLLVYTSSDVPKPIPDVTTIQSIVSVPDVGTVKRTILKLDISHTWDSDVDISFKSPGGTTIDVSSDNGSSGDNYTATVFDDLCGTLITSGSPPFTGCYKPEQTLASFNNQVSNGTWTLIVADDAGGISGTLNSWGMALCVTP